MTPNQVMAKLGVQNFKMNPKMPTFDEFSPIAEKYSRPSASEIEDEEVGPYCVSRSCIIPYGVSIGNNNIPIKLFISFRDSTITEMDISFTQPAWDEVYSIVFHKYQSAWTAETTAINVIDYETKEATRHDRIFVRNTTGGVNQSTHDICEIWGTNIDIVFKHHDSLGPLHSMIVLRLVSKNF